MSVNNSTFTHKDLHGLLHHMITSRVIDEIEREYTARGEAFFHVSGAGHEGVAMLHPFLTSEDWLHTHYRDKALLLARGVSAYSYFLALFNKDESHSRGRQMNAHMSDPSRNILSLVGPVGNNALQAAGVGAVLKEQNDSNAIVFCAQGEGTTHQGEFLESMTLAVRDSLPVLFFIEDNQYAISTYTQGKTFYQIGDYEVKDYLGCPIVRIDGRYPHRIYEQIEGVITDIRKTGKPVIVIFSVDRLESHTNADDHKIYRDEQSIITLREHSDPIVNLIAHLYETENQEEARQQLETLKEAMLPMLRAEASRAQRAAEPSAVCSTIAPVPTHVRSLAEDPYEPGECVMLEAIREVLDARLERNSHVFLYGEDIEDPKGDVFGVTKGLSTKYPGRVVNSPLSESLIVGTSIGRALAGARPVAFLQFADFFPLAFNQIYSELGSMYWRTDGGWQAPVIVMVTCGGYRPGLGPFHASVMESVAGHVPGIDILSPSNAADAAGMLNAAFHSHRPTVFFYPKNQLNVKRNTISKKRARNYVVVPGTAGIVSTGTDITLVGYGNTVPLCDSVASNLEEAGKTAEVIDLRSIQPLDHETILRSVKKTGVLLVTHEDTCSMGVGAEVIARISEHDPSIITSRLTRADTYVPCNFGNQLEVLPSHKKILEKAVTLLGGTVTWEHVEQKVDGIEQIKAVGSSPSDESFTIISWTKEVGDHISEGEVIVEGEADKATVDLQSGVSGEISELLYKEDDVVDVGTVIATIKTDEKVVRTITREELGIPHITFHAQVHPSRNGTLHNVYMGYTNAVLGSRVVDNDELCRMSPEWTSEKILSSTGIASRHWLGDDQTLVSIATEAAQKALRQSNLGIFDIDGIICATGTHAYQTPSLATMVQYELLRELSDDDKERYVGYAYDISAACSGFLFALSNAYNRALQHKGNKFLFITAEYLSERVDITDYQTAPVFSDAATASIVSSSPMEGGALVYEPILRTVGAPPEFLMVPERGYIKMDGIEVYKNAVKHLKNIALDVCNINKIDIHDIDIIVPHQANAKIVSGVARRLKLPLEKFFMNIDKHGNSSSNTIPICLEELQAQQNLKGKSVLLIAFGGGYTFGGTLLRY